LPDPVAQAPAPAAKAPAPPPFPLDISLEFNLVDHFGQKVSEADYRGMPVLLFFGFANCESICTVALPRIGKALDLLGDEAGEIAAVMVTIDPERDTPDEMRLRLPHWHERLVGLTGSEEALARIWADFQVNREVVAEDPAGGAIYAHGSFIYFIGADGQMKTMVPPILGADRLAELARAYF
ncbi:MAG: SCO family protein, partial [Pseudomonadota bacterium]